MAKDNIEPNVILTLTTNYSNIPIIITNFTGNIITMTHIEKVGYSYYHIRKRLKEVMNSLIDEYGVNTILIEQNQLFIDKIDKYPDPYVLKNIQLGFGVQTTIEDAFWEKVPYIMELPKWEWKKAVLNKKVEYAIDLYKSHILLRKSLSEEQLKQIDENNYYETLCLSEGMLCSKFLKKSYQINK
jgi:hypothetical protein